METFVVVKTRTGKNEEFQWDGAPLMIDAKKGARLTRYQAEHAINGNALRWDKTSGNVVESKVYIEDDIGTPFELPWKPIDEKKIKELKKTDGLGNDKILVDGKLVKKMSVDLDPQTEDEDK